MIQLIRTSISITILLALLVCGVYPAVVTGFGQSVLGRQASGSLVYKDGVVVGSERIGQPFANARYFHGRPSAAGKGYDAASSSGSNLGPTSKVLADRFEATAKVLRQMPQALQRSQGARNVLPVDLLTASGSGLDPHISPEAALWQVSRVATARGLAPEKVRMLIQSHIEGLEWGLFGTPRVNVLALNMALDGLK